jgi:hypothetical protein
MKDLRFGDNLLELTGRKCKIENWDDLVDPNVKDYKELVTEALNESIQAIENTDFILTLQKYKYEDGNFWQMD